ncbi:MAG: hypothetical protein LQ347_001267 [Umbilicaria vellea]|nr:MAG: hypothetical protein LQ347_001267 [Umbilicaria vellea]
MPRAPRPAPAQSFHHHSAPYPKPANDSRRSSPNDQRAPASAWSDSDDNKLIQARHQGLAWQQIATKCFPSKSPNACRKRHERLQERLKSEQWDGVKVEDVAKAYVEVREEMWKILASQVEGGRWKVVEAKCMEKGLKTLLSAGRNAKRRSKSDTSGGGNDSDHDDPNDDPNNDSGIAFTNADSQDENGTSGPMPPMQGPASSSSPPPPPPPASQYHISSSSEHKTSSKSSNRPNHHAPPLTPMPQSATAPSRPSSKHSFEMPSIASLLQSVSVPSF